MSASSRVLAPIVVALALASVAAPACAPAGSSGAGAPAAGGLPDRDPALACKLVRERGALLLDVRSDEEFAAGHLEGALHVPHDQLASRLDEVLAQIGGDRGRPVVTYCRSGRRSGIAKETLVDAGFTQVTNLGGMSAWTDC